MAESISQKTTKRQTREKITKKAKQTREKINRQKKSKRKKERKKNIDRGETAQKNLSVKMTEKNNYKIHRKK